MTSSKKTNFITSLVKKETEAKKPSSDEDWNDQEKPPTHNQDNLEVSKVCSGVCKKKEITVDYCASLHSLSPTELNIHVKGLVLSKSCQSNFSLRKGSLEQAFLGNKKIMRNNRLVFQVISKEFDKLIKCVKVELTDSGEYSGNCIFSKELTSQVEGNLHLWSIIEVLEYDIIADKFLQIRKYKVLKNTSFIIGDPDPDPIEDSLFLKIHRGDYPISSCMHNQVNRNQMGQTFHTKPVIGFSSGSRHARAVPCPSSSFRSESGSLQAVYSGSLQAGAGPCPSTTPSRSSSGSLNVATEYQTFLEPRPKLRHAGPPNE